MLREKRDMEKVYKKIISSIGYKVINYFIEVNIPTNVGDFLNNEQKNS